MNHDQAPRATHFFNSLLGVGDGVRTRFELVKDYDGQARRITRPAGGSVRVAVDGVETGPWTLAASGVVEFDDAPAVGAAVTAGFRFDVPVRFAEDRLDVSRATFLAGEAVSGTADRGAGGLTACLSRRALSG